MSYDPLQATTVKYCYGSMSPCFLRPMFVKMDNDLKFVHYNYCLFLLLDFSYIIISSSKLVFFLSLQFSLPFPCL
ncbi:hypothetical protein VNO77_21291 [Canavalia gladiata]|uniref:Uncharacterized protein n=1 Tax=Canavalia gladiata TaxID=3824 RepID=A0AAN9LUA6_CANGL